MSDAERDQAANPDAIVADIVRRLKSLRKSVRKEAERRLAELAGDSPEHVLRAACHASAKWSFSSFGWWLATIVGWNAVFQFLNASGHHHSWWHLGRTLLIWMPLFLIFAVLVRGSRNWLSTVGGFVPALTKVNDVRALEPLLDAYALSGREGRAAIESALATILEANHRAAWNGLSPTYRTQLNLHLDRFRNATAVEAILRFFAACGDRPELHTARRLSRRSKDMDVRRAAVECATTIEARLEGRTERDVLLRPSQSSADAEALLHPAEGQTRNGQPLLQPAGSGTEAREQNIAVVPVDQ